jgi:aminopeptidase YwaD
MIKKYLSILFAFFFFANISFSQSAKNITADDIKTHISYLASDKLEGRYPGTEGDILSRDYISGELKSYGLIPIGDSSYFQKFSIKGSPEIGNNNTLEITGCTNLILSKDFSPLGISANGKTSGELVFAGYGIVNKDLNINDYQDSDGKEIDVKGKIVVIFEGSPNYSMPQFEDVRYKTYIAKSRNAAGIILVYGFGTSFRDELYSFHSDRDANDAGIQIINVKTDIIDKIFKEKNFDLQEIEKEIIKTKKGRAFVLNSVTAEFNVEIISTAANTTNILGFIEGNDPVLKNEVIVIGGHYDHLGWGNENSLYQGKAIHHGADDNASGTAGVLELAQEFSQNKEFLKRSFIFMCFSGEEEGLLGSAYFTKSPLFEKFNIIAMINLDMVGRMTDDKLVVSGTGTSSVWDTLLTSTNRIYNFSLSLNEEGMGGSDHTSFYLKQKPVLFFFSGIHGDYHKPSDTYDKINYAGEEKILKYAFDVVMKINYFVSKPDYVDLAKNKKDDKTDEKEKKVTFKVYTGTIPDFSGNVDGYKISGVQPGSPAEKAGLTGGDIIIKFAGKEIKNISDYTYALGEHKPDEVVDVEVNRNGEILKFQITLTKK